MRNKRTDVHQECNTVGTDLHVGKIILQRIREERKRLLIKKYDSEKKFSFPVIMAHIIIAKIKEQHSYHCMINYYISIFFFIITYKIILIIVRASLFFLLIYIVI